MKEAELDGLIEDVLAEIANPAMSARFAQRLKQRSFAMSAIAERNVLVFASMNRTGGRRMSPSAVTVAALLNVAALLLLMVQVSRVRTAESRKTLAEIVLTAPPLAVPPRASVAGGGGGQAGPAPVSKGNPPKFAAEQLNPPKAPPLDQPKINVPVTVDVDPNLRMAKTDLSNLGMPNAPLVGTSLGNGRGTGIGSGSGGGIGSGSGGNMGGGLRRIGGGVSAPIVLFAPEPEFSEEARKAKAAGNVLVYLQVDAQGRPTHVHVLRGIGLGLDEKAVEAVRQYKFKPALEDGKPVPVEMNVEVNFQIF